MKSELTKVATLAAALAAVSYLNAQTILDTGHVGIGVAYEDGWDLHVHHHDLGELEPADTLLQVNPQALTTVPSGSEWSFLGSAGSPVWVLPQSHGHDLLFLGLESEEIEDGVFLDDEFSLSLTGVSGPGSFSVFTTSFGVPTVLMNSGDGFSSADTIVLPAGAHRHVNWGFTAPGDYTVTFEAAGTLVAGSQSTQSGPVDYYFTVVPEPSSAALVGVGIATLFLWVRRRNQTRG